MDWGVEFGENRSRKNPEDTATASPAYWREHHFFPGWDVATQGTEHAAYLSSS